PSASTLPRFIEKSLAAVTAQVVPLVPVLSVSRMAFWTVTLTWSVGDTVLVLTASGAAIAAFGQAAHRAAHVNKTAGRKRRRFSPRGRRTARFAPTVSRARQATPSDVSATG